MKRTENECVNCGLPCIGDTCPYKRVTRYYCDECGDECTLYEYEGKELCIGCVQELLIESLTVVPGSE